MFRFRDVATFLASAVLALGLALYGAAAAEPSAPLESASALPSLVTDPPPEETPPTTATVTIVKVIDTDNDETTTEDRVRAPGWTFETVTETGAEATYVTGGDPSGEVTFQVEAAFDGSELSIVEAAPDPERFALLDASCVRSTPESSTPVPPVERSDLGLTIPIDAGNDYVCQFTNTELPDESQDGQSSLRIAKWIDLDGDLRNDENQDLAAGWAFGIYVEQDVGLVEETSDEDEDFGTINVVLPVSRDGTVVAIDEIQQDGFTLTQVICAVVFDDGRFEEFPVDLDGTTVTFLMEDDSNYGCAFVNQPDDAVLPTASATATGSTPSPPAASSAGVTLPPTAGIRTPRPTSTGGSLAVALAGLMAVALTAVVTAVQRRR